MISQACRRWKNAQGPNSLVLTSDKLQKKEYGHSRHSIQSKLTRLYFDELHKVPYATPDSVLVRPLAMGIHTYFEEKMKYDFFFNIVTQNNLENECDLLGRLVQREGLHTLIVNLYAGNKGYSLAVRNR